MAGIVSDESGVGGNAERSSSEQCYQSGEALTEWRSSEQVENGTPSTSLAYWDSDDDEDGPKPSELFGTHTWEIKKFSQIKRELRSDAFEIGGYKWYILIYPQGCDVSNHLSLFLCVANHDKLLPGWSHFAQFTIAVMHKDPKKTKYSDTLHRFWKKEHDWGWKKFMELSKVLEGFIQDDNLTIMAQVQVIREKADRPFRCLDCQYRRELLRVYLSNVEQICRRFVEERRSKLGKLIEDKARWSSFRSFWSGVDQNTRCHMSREKTDMILKVVVKQFFIEKEVTSTLVMDSLYSGLKALEGHNKNRREKLLASEEPPAPIVRVENDMFVLVDDIVALLERAAIEPLPPKDDKGPQNRKDGNSGEEVSKDSTERDERRLTELGRRTVELFVFAHIFSNKIEVAYQEAVALKRQEELIREEEAAGLAENGQKARRGMSEKDKKSKKKQAKQKRNNRKEKDKGKEQKPGFALQNKHLQQDISHDKKDFVLEQEKQVLEKPDIPDAVSDVSDSVECVTEVLQPDSEDRDASLVYSDTDTSEVHPSTEASGSNSAPSSVQNGICGKKSPSVVDDSSSTCSTDSIPSVVMNGPYKGKSSVYRNQKSPSRGKNRGKMAYGGSCSSTEIDSQPSGPVIDAGDFNDVSGSSKGAESEPEAVISSQNLPKCIEQAKEGSSQSIKDPIDEERHSNEKTIIRSPSSPPKNVPTSVQLKPDVKTTATSDPVVRKASQNSPREIDRYLSKPETQKGMTPKSPEKTIARTAPATSRPTSAPIVSAPRPTTPVVSVVQTSPLLARSVSAAGRLGPDSSTASHNRVSQSYKNAIMGNSFASSSSACPGSPTSGVNSLRVHPQSSSLGSPMFVPQRFERIDSNSVQTGFSFGIVAHEPLQNGPQWMQNPESDANRTIHSDQFLPINNMPNLEPYNQENFSDFPACTSGRQIQGVLADEFPHLDIINDLLDDEHVAGKSTRAGTVFQSHSNSAHLLNRNFSFPSEAGILGDMVPTTSCCRFERIQSFHDDGFDRDYSSSGGLFDSREYILQAGGPPYGNGQIDRAMPTQWQVTGSNVPIYGMNFTEADSYPYDLGYSNMGCSVNGYTLYQPSSGHRK